MNKILIVLVVAAITGCSSGKKQLTRGNYEVAVDQAVSRLKSKPNSKRAKEALTDAYPYALDLHLNKIAQLKSSNEQFRWDQIANSYDQLSHFYEIVKRCPACSEILPGIQNYRTEFNEASLAAAEERYAAGVTELAKNTRESAKDAYRHFQRVEYLSPNYKDTNQKLDEARYNATLRVLVDQIPVHSRQFGITHEFFQNRINEYLRSAKLNEFVRFYTVDEVDTEGISEPDHVVVLQFDDFVVGQTFIKENTKQVSRDSVVVGTVDVDGVAKDVYGTVEAEYISTVKYLDSGGLLDMKIFDANTGRILLQRKMPGEFHWVCEWATYKGDKRALTEEELATTKNAELPPPSPQFLFKQFSKPIYDQVATNFRKFYSGY
ncbi:MAG: hypothetical protein GY816_20555 [Cytophagales bacterium]|nr:hypothetical protein [Cytophagales bacterium]